VQSRGVYEDFVKRRRGKIYRNSYGGCVHAVLRSNPELYSFQTALCSRIYSHRCPLLNHLSPDAAVMQALEVLSFKMTHDPDMFDETRNAEEHGAILK
jgi:hypothetical protein